MSDPIPDSPGSPSSTPPEEHVDANSLFADAGDVDPDMMSVDFSGDFTNRTDVIKAMAARWSQYVPRNEHE